MILTLHNNPFQPNLVHTLSFLQLETNRNDETIEIQFFHSCIHTCISVKESSGLDQKYLGLKNWRKLYIKLAIQTTWFFKRYVDVKQFN